MSNESENEETNEEFDFEAWLPKYKKIKEMGYHAYWNQGAQELVGKTIVQARYITKEDADAMGIDWWRNSTMSLLLDDGTLVFTSSDDEMNSAGVLKAFRSNGEAILMPHIPLEE